MKNNVYLEKLNLTNLEKIYWPNQSYTKAHLLEYYLKISEHLLPFLYNRPLVLKRYPHGINGKSFYQKNAPLITPDWVECVTIEPEKKKNFRKMLMINNVETLLWVVNLGSIELHQWLSQKNSLLYPDIVVFDLDPQSPANFSDTFFVAEKINEIMDLFNINIFPKTSGSNGLHIFISIYPNFDFLTIRETVKNFFNYLVKLLPDLVTIEQKKEQRKGKIYLDYLQNGYGKTMASAYSVRPLENAPISMPITWEEVKKRQINPEDFTIENALDRLNEKGNIFLPLLEKRSDFSLFVKTFFEKNNF